MAAALLVVSACSEKEPIKIGFVGGLTGRTAYLGVGGRNGALLAVEEVNAAGGINGRTVELIAEDDKQDKKEAYSAAKRLIDAQVVAIIGHMTSSATEASLPLVNEARVPMVSPTSTSERFSGRDDYFFRVIASTSKYAATMADYIKAKGDVKSLVIIYDQANEAYSTSWVEQFEQSLSGSDVKLLGKYGFKGGGSIRFEQLARKSLEQSPDGVVMVASAVDSAMLCQQLRKLDGDVNLYSSEWGASEKLIELAGHAVEGLVFAQFFNRDSTRPEYLAFKDRFEERFGEPPGFAAVNAYDAANLVIEALKKNPGGKALKKTIQEISTFEGLQGPIELDSFGDSNREAVIATIEEGKFKVLE